MTGRSQRARLLVATIVVVLLTVDPAPGKGARDASIPDGRSILASAFSNLYDIDITANIDLIMRNRSGQERVRRLRAASKVIDERTHSIGRLVSPSYLRGMTILTIEADNRSHDAFIYLPSMGKVRRITTAQRGDAFLGSDVTYEDMERRRVDEYAVQEVTTSEWDGEPAFVVRATPLGRQTYDQVEFWIARADSAILRSRTYRNGRTEPYRTVRSPREHMIELQGHTLPTRILVENPSRGTTTEVVFTNLELAPQLADELFSLSTLEQTRPLPGE